ncbi:MAG: PAS domain S-box protein [Methanoregula sp.]|nr:PAS domain S-box protein [Methanoregula sp.]
MASTMISVLYVDDEPGLLEIARLFLEESGGFRIGTSTSAREVLESSSIPSYEAIVSDYQMPEMDGIAFLKAVRERFGDVPFILFTGRGREEVVIEAINNGADFYIQKGGDPEAQFAELAHKIRQAVARRRAEHLRTESEKRLLDIINFLPDATFAIDRSGKVIAWNRAIEEMTGIPADTMLGKGDHEYSIPFYGTRRPILIDLIFEPDHIIRKTYSHIIHEKDTLMADTSLPRPRGKDVTFFGKASPLYNRQGEIVGAIESIRDITGHKKAEKALQDSERTLRINEERLVMAQEIGHLGSWEYDLKANTIWGSAEALRIFGFPPVAGDFPIKEIEACIPGRERVHQALVDLIACGKEYNLEYAIDPADGSASKMIHSIGRLERDDAGDPLKVRGVIQDITGRKQAEEELRFKNVILSTQQETSLDGILIVDESGRILHYNHKFTVIWGIPGSLIASQTDEPVLQYVVGQLADPEAFLSRVRYLYDHKDERSFEELPLKDGRILERFSAPMLGETGKYYGRVWYFRDITERKRAEEQLRESEARFHSLHENMIEGVALHQLISDSEGVPEDYIIVEANAAFEKHLGISRERVIGKTSREAYGVTEPPYLERYARVALTGEPEVFETYFPPLDKYFSISAYCPAKGFFATIFEDITDRKLAEQELRENEERYRLISENTLDIIYTLDLQGRITHASPHVTKYGYTPEYLISRHVSEVIYEEDLGRILAAIQTAITSGLSKPVTFRLKDAAGNLVWVEDNGTILKDSSGKVVGITGVLRDITERRHADVSLRESQRMLTEAMDLAQLANWEHDLRTNFFTFDDRFYALYGTTAEREGGNQMPAEVYVREFVHPEDRGVVMEEAEKAVRTTDPHYVSQREHRIIRRDGEIRHIIVRIGITKDAEGRTIKTHGANQDITERKTAEEALSRANRQLSLLTGITRHDIINKVSVVLGFLKIVGMKFKDPALAGYLEKMESATTEIRSQIEFTRIYENIGTHEPRWIALDEVMPRSQVPETMTLHAAVQGISVFADPMLEKVFFNLLDNSLRHGQRVTEIRVSSSRSGKDLVVVWEDNGIGIVSDEKDLIFERDFGKNTGLGMFLVREILSLTGITITETGTPGSGARFEIVVPDGAYRIVAQQ